MSFPDDPDDENGFVPPVHPDDRLWRHPSELGGARRASSGGTGPVTAETAPIGVPRVWTVAAASVLIGVAVTLAVLSITGTFDGPTTRTVVEQVETALPNDPGGEAQVAARIGPALVRVDVTTAAGVTHATGVVFRSDGHLLTTADALDGATAVTVTTQDGAVLTGTIVGSDHTTDVAVIDVDRNDMTTAVLGRVSQLEAGESAVALATSDEPGTSPAVAVGHVSAVGLRLDVTDGTSLHDMISAAVDIQLGAAGIVLCDGNGAVLGLVTARTPDTQASLTPTVASGTATTTTVAVGMPTIYATPIDYAAQLADEMIETGTVRHTWLGVFGDDLDPASAALIGRAGARITRVVDGSPAADAHLQVGDVVLALDGVQVTSMSSLVVALRSLPADQPVDVTYQRDGAQFVTTVTLTSRS